MSGAFGDILDDEHSTSIKRTIEYSRGEYRLQSMCEWVGDVEVDFVCSDPPFGIDFSGKKSNYNRDSDNVVDGYVEWGNNEYETKVHTLLDVIDDVTHSDGHGCIFSGWNNSHKIHQTIEDHETLNLEGKLYWNYNFAPYCKRRPAHNVYEVFWVTKSDEYYYTNECSYDHCQEGEANLSAIDVNREYIQEMPKYPTRLPPKIVAILIEHFTSDDDIVLDPLAGSGTIGLVADEMEREWYCGDSNSEALDVFDETTTELTGDIV